MAEERRRHARAGAGFAAQLEVRGSAVAVARVIDLSAGGALVELVAGDPPPALGARARATLIRGVERVERGARVVRVRWTGRERGRALPPAAALVFDDGDAAAAARLHELLAR